jgi:hypothetical protein
MGGNRQEATGTIAPGRDPVTAIGLPGTRHGRLATCAPFSSYPVSLGVHRLKRIGLAFRCFFGLLFGGALSDSVLRDLGLSRRAAAPAPPPAKAVERSPADGALQILGILQRDSRLVDFLMEDITPYTEDQVGAAARKMHDDCRKALLQYVRLDPVIDGVEGTFAKAPSPDPNVVRFVGNVPAKPPAGGTLVHKGWRAAKIDLPPLGGKQDPAIIAPAEIEIE